MCCLSSPVFLGFPQLSFADIAVFEFVTGMAEVPSAKLSLQDYPVMEAFVQRVGEVPEIKEEISKASHAFFSLFLSPLLTPPPPGRAQERHPVIPCL